MKTLTIILLLLSFLAMSLGGLSDYTGEKYIISKEHYWNDGYYLLILAIFAEELYDPNKMK
jgi:hypothetical protein